MKQSRHAISMLIEKYRAIMQKMWRKNQGADDAGLRRCRTGVCAAALLVSLAVSPGLAAAEAIDFDGSNLSLLKPEPIGGIANSLFPFSPLSVTGNIVTVTGGIVPGYVYGGVANSANTSVTNNTVNISGGTVTGHVYGGLSWGGGGSAGSNHVNITGGTVQSSVFGGYSNISTATGNTVTISNGTLNSLVYGGRSYNDATGNNVTISGGTVNDHVYGGYSYSGNADTNTVDISGGTVGRMVFGGLASSNGHTSNGNIIKIANVTLNYTAYSGYTNSTNGTADGNSLTVSNATVADIYGASAGGNATNNTVTVNSGSITQNSVYGGSSDNGDASSNSVTINGGTVKNASFTGIYGGYSSNGNANNNSVTINGGTINKSIYGGWADKNATNNTVTIAGNGSLDLTNSVLYGGRNFVSGVGDVVTGNTLNVKRSNVSVKGIANFQNYNFYLPAAVTPGSTMLAVTNAVDLTGATVGVGLAGAPTVLRQGDQVTLINAPAGLTAPAGINGTIARVLVSIARADTFTLTTDTENLYATATSLQGSDTNLPGGGSNPPAGGLEPQTKALLEGRMASIAQINQGADLLVSQGMANARSATGSSNAPAGFFAMSGNHNRYETGSHVDVNGLSLVAGVSKQKLAKNGTVLNGLFLEYGKGNYSTYNSFAGQPSIRGDGDTRYFGGGYLARSQASSGQYLEGSFRLGRVSTDFRSAPIAGKNVDYDISAPYYGLHLAFGKEREVGQNRTLDTYIKAIWTHQNASSATVTEEPINFDAVNSHRWQLGMKLLRKVNDQTTVRTGLAYQHEFDGKAGGTANGQSIDSPSLKGGSSIVELGVTITPKKDNNAPFFDISLQGFAGKCKGIAGNVQSTWKF